VFRFTICIKIFLVIIVGSIAIPTEARYVTVNEMFDLFQLSVSVSYRIRTEVS
jgi:hypothetical protein